MLFGLTDLVFARGGADWPAVRGFNATPFAWLGFISTPSNSFCEFIELFDVLSELFALPATLFWDRVLFKSARVPGGDG